MNIKMGLNRQITSSGSLGLFDITDDLVIRVVTEGAGPSNAVVVRGRIKGQSALNTLQTITGSTSTTVPVATYEEIEIDCTTYDSLGAEVKVIVTSFDQDISSTAVPIGAATAARQDTGNASLASIDAKTPALVGGKVPVEVSNITGTVEITNDAGNAIPVSAASLPLPSGASTEAKQDQEITKLTSIDNKTPALVSGKVPVDVGTPSVTVSNGSIEISNDDGNPIPVSASSLPLPTGASTSALQTTANTSLSNIDGKLPALTAGNRVPVDIGGNGSITITSGTITVQNEVEIKNDTGNPVPISVSSLPLPSGAATETTLNSVKTAAESLVAKDFATQTTLSAINTKTPSLGQAAMAGSVPVTIASNQTAVPASQSGTWDINNISGTINLPTGAATSALQTTGNTSLGNIDTKIPNNLTVTSTRLLVDGSGVTQPISAAALPLPTDAATETTLSGVSNKLPATLGQKTSASSLSVVVASDQTPLPISGTITSTQVAGVEDPTNSSTSPLLANEVFTGAAFNVTGYVAINVNIKSDVPSATGGVRVEFSPDGTNWDHAHSTNYTAATGVGYIFNVEYKFARVVYTNGATPQTYFRLLTIFKSTLTKSSLYTLSQAINSNMFAELGRSVITGETTAGGGGYVNVKVDPSGAMITATTIDTALPAGNNNIGNVDVATLPITYGVGSTTAQTPRVVVASDQTIPVSAASLPLPAGAATSALQTTGNSAISSFSAKTGASMVAVAHDEVVVTYVGTSNRISTVVYKLATATVATLTFSYDGSNRLTGVVRS